ncbi:MnhB domain-containing protein [Methanococcus voltae]|uniref:MnhB domain-containing protein n=1 Tax=Methanococcus voltae TaxID=2188 RepID=UPI001FD9BF86|nr:MnhB domain-containing protein [Methanococcus voltae]MBP2172317.1 energy-converting hydrogenase B subunit I [Methanococcus voltae]
MRNIITRDIAVFLSFLFFGVAILYSIFNINVVEGVNAVYTSNYVIPNFVTAVLFDWRAFDTLGECLILVTSVMVTGMVFGRGMYNTDFLKSLFCEDTQDGQNAKYKNHKNPDLGFTSIIKVITMPLSVIIMVLGIVTILAGHITPGGGFQGGALISVAYILGIIGYGTKSPIGFTHHFLEKLETFGALFFMIMGALGIFVSGYYLLNVSVLNGVSLFPSPQNMGAVGLIPYLNIAVGFKVLAGLSSISLLLSTKKIFTNSSGLKSSNS